MHVHVQVSLDSEEEPRLGVPQAGCNQAVTAGVCGRCKAIDLRDGPREERVIEREMLIEADHSSSRSLNDCFRREGCPGTLTGSVMRISGMPVFASHMQKTLSKPPLKKSPVSTGYLK